MAKKIKVLFTIPALDRGGTERQLLELLKNYPKEEFEFHLLMMKKNSAYEEEARKCVKTFSVIEKQARFDFRVIFRFAKVFNEINPDILHAFNLMIAPLTYFSKIFSKCKAIIIHGGLRGAPRTFDRKSALYTKLFPLFKIIVANSRAGLKAYGEAGKKGRLVIYNGFDFARIPNLDKAQARKKLSITQEKFVVSMIANIDYRKDHRTFLQAIELIEKKSKDNLYLIVGDGSLRDEMENLAKKLKINHCVKFLGRRSDVEEILLASDISTLCSSNGEGISNSIVESLACGVPVIATKIGGNSESVNDGKNGFLVKEKDPQDIADKVLTLKNNKEIRQQFSIEAKRTVKEKFSVEKMIDSYSELYKNLLIDNS